MPDLTINRADTADAIDKQDMPRLISAFKNMIIYGNAAAALSVTRHGTCAAFPNRCEVEKKIDAMRI